MIVTSIPAPPVKVGDQVRAIFIPGVTGKLIDENNKFTGQVVTVDQITDNVPNSYSDGIQRNGSRAYGSFIDATGDTMCWYMTEWEHVPSAPLPDDEAANPTIELTEQEQEIARLKELNRVQAERITNLIRNEQHNSDVLSAAYRTQKEMRGWCDEAATVAQEINEEFCGELRIEIEQEFDVEVRVTASFEYVFQKTVMAASREAAEEMVTDSPEDFIEQYEIDDALGYDGWTDISYELY